MYSRADYAPVVEQFVLDGQQAKLTQASLETLAVIAYRQPVSRARVAPCAVSTSTASSAPCSPAGSSRRSGHDEESTRDPLRHHAVLPRAAGPAGLDDLPALAPYLPDVDVLDEIAEGGRS